VDLQNELRLMQLDSCKHRELEIGLRQENQKLKAQVLLSEKQKQEQAQGLAGFQESITAQFTSKLDEYREQMERESKAMADTFPQELAKAKGSHYLLLSTS
jgi:DNA anti-recombination protein RmuC